MNIVVAVCHGAVAPCIGHASNGSRVTNTCLVVHVVGALLVLALLVTPAAAALRLSKSQLWVPVLSVSFALVAMLGGILLALGGGLPISPYVTTISFLIYLSARLIAFVKSKWVKEKIVVRS